MIESALQVFEETTTERRMEAIMETEVVNLIETANHEAAKGEQTPFYQASENVVRRAVTWVAVNDVIHTKVIILA